MKIKIKITESTLSRTHAKRYNTEKLGMCLSEAMSRIDWANQKKVRQKQQETDYKRNWAGEWRTLKERSSKYNIAREMDMQTVKWLRGSFLSRNVQFICRFHVNNYTKKKQSKKKLRFFFIFLFSSVDNGVCVRPSLLLLLFLVILSFVHFSFHTALNDKTNNKKQKKGDDNDEFGIQQLRQKVFRYPIFSFFPFSLL